MGSLIDVKDTHLPYFDGIPAVEFGRRRLRASGVRQTGGVPGSICLGKR